MKKIALLVIALMLIPTNAFASASKTHSYYNTDVRYGKRTHMLKSLGINHHSYTIRKKNK